MFQGLSDKFRNIFSSLTGVTKLTEDNVSEAVRNVRLALLDADVSYPIVSSFVKKVKERALGTSAEHHIQPKDYFVKIVHDELVQLMGSAEPSLSLKRNPSVWMLVGLQGVGKTTQAVKLAVLLKGKKFLRSPLIIAADLQRPAAIEQLKILGQKAQVAVFSDLTEKDPLRVVRAGMEHARKNEHDVVLIDTAGRLHIDQPLMEQIQQIKEITDPDEVLFVASAATGQDAVQTAVEFHKAVSITGSILTMLDGTARAGAALSILEVTKCPLKFEGIGEGIMDIQVFNPSSMADRILGMGDVINLVKKVENTFDPQDQPDLEKKLLQGSFTYKDFLEQLTKLSKLGPMKGLLKMIPGMPDLPDDLDFEKDSKKAKAIILSMTSTERQGETEIDHGRRQRIAKGSGTGIEDVNRLVKGFKQAKLFSKNIPQLKKKFKSFGGLGGLF
ncbi:MAG: signal recognition particle protein [Chlamydiae bacterium]|nr:signal recognition particle protein [Chlamydiota bacterium]